MKFHYRLFRFNRPLLSLGGRFVRPRPVVTVTVVGPAGSWPESALLDTAADDTVFHESLARRAGIDLTGAPTGVATAAGLAGATLAYVQVHMRLTDGKEYREWPAWVGFTSAFLAFPLLGFAGCLPFFSANYFGDREEVELTVNSLYPGT
jgi:hypothetical protein